MMKMISKNPVYLHCCAPSATRTRDLLLIRKSVSYRARASTRRSVSVAGFCGAGSGGGLEGDGVAEGFELADVVALAAFGVDAAGVVAGPEVAELGVGVGEQVPGDDQDGAADGDDGALGAAAAGDAPVSFAEEGVGLGGSGGGVAQDGGQVGVAVPGRAFAFLLPGRFLDARCQPGP